MKAFKVSAIIWSSSIGLCFFLIWTSNNRVEFTTAKQIHSTPSEITEGHIGVIFGTSPYVVGGRQNMFFNFRIDAAAQLYKSEKITHILVSGDNRHYTYNEPLEMQKALIKQGIPESAITLDYAGLRTFDSVIRASKIFCVKNPIFISQEFQLERALYIANEKGIKATGYKARDVKTKKAMKTYIREYFARVKAILDIHILNTQPRHLGQIECIE